MKYTLIVFIICVAAIQDASAFYSAEQGRWLNRDPIREKGGINVYGFVHNSPLNKYDILGLEADAPPPGKNPPTPPWGRDPRGDLKCTAPCRLKVKLLTPPEPLDWWEEINTERLPGPCRPSNRADHQSFACEWCPPLVTLERWKGHVYTEQQSCVGFRCCEDGPYDKKLKPYIYPSGENKEEFKEVLYCEPAVV